MPRRVDLLLLLICALSAASSIQAQSEVAQETRQHRNTAGIGSCDLGVASADLDEGGVRARLYNTGGLFWRDGESGYELPKDSGIQAISAAGIWLGGTVDGTLRFAGTDYTDAEWWPGPLDASGAPPVDCAAFDRVWIVTRQRNETITGDVVDWPADLGAPFDDIDGDGVYEPEAGERPTVYGHQTAFWVMNDRGNVHAWSGAEPLGLTARVTAHTFAVSRPALGFGTFYRYEFENPNAYTIENARFGFWSDAIIGTASDDYMGSDPERGMAFVYNSDPRDGDAFGGQPPALGVDILSGAAGALHYEDDASVRGVPISGAHAYDYLNFRFPDGTPLTVGGLGYNPDDPTATPTTWQWPGAPEHFAYWSEFDLDGEGTANTALDHRFVAVAEPFELGAGARHTVDLAILWGRGVSFLDSVTKVRAHSDQVQAAYDAGTLFALGGARTGSPVDEPALPLVALDTPVLTFPADGADLDNVPLPRTDPACTPEDRDRDCTEVELTWDEVPDALFYEVQIDTTPNLSRSPITLVRQPSLLAAAFTDNGPEDVYWRVRARNPTEVSRFSDTQHYTTRYFVPAIRNGGIVEVTYADTLTCETTPNVFGCEDYDGATVWQLPNPSADYYVSALAGELDRLESYIDIAAPYDYELRFTEACAASGCYGINYQSDGTGTVITVPFEVWQIGISTPDDASDDVRMIPFLLEAEAPLERWRYAAAPNPGNGDDVDTPADFTAPVSDAISWMYPDRPGGYALLAQAAARTDLGTPLPDADDQIDLDPSTETPCGRQGFFVDFCYRNDLLSEGNLARDRVSLISSMVLADQAGDGTPPPPGTTIRLLTSKSAPIDQGDEPEPGENTDVEDPLPSVPEVITLDVFPNPVRDVATIEYGQVGRSGATLKVYDTLGRLVAQLDEGVLEPGTYRESFDVSALTGGMYWVVFRSVNARLVRPMSVIR